MSSDPEAGKEHMVEIAAAQGVTLTTEEGAWLPASNGRRGRI